MRLNSYDKYRLLLELIFSLNKGNCCSYDERVRMAEIQLNQIVEFTERDTDKEV